MSEISTVLGSVRLRYKGPHNPATEYSFNDLVSANGGSYAYINHTPAAGVPLTDTSHWQQIASKGDPYDPTAYDDVPDVSNVFACDVDNATHKNFAIAIADTSAKTITFSNVPDGRCEVFVEITASATAAMTWTLDGGTLAWSTGSAPTLTTGKTYRILFITSDGGTKWAGYAALGV